MSSWSQLFSPVFLTMYSNYFSTLKMLCLNSLCVIKFRTLQMSWYTEVGMGGKEKDNLEVKRGRIKSHIRDM